MLLRTKKEYNVVAIIQARNGSTRLPGKIFLPLNDKPILLHVFNRLKTTNNIDKIVIATTTEKDDDKVEDFCSENSIDFIRGSSDDVLSRYYHAATKYKADTIVRITSDCPLIDPIITDKIIESFFMTDADYMSNCIVRTFPRGLDTEVFSLHALTKAFHNANQKPEREHVTPFIYNNSNIFNVKNYIGDKDYSNLRWTVDTKEDYELVKKIYNMLYPNKKIFLMNDILELINQQPDLLKINQHIEQKKLGE